jgi:hypothetical protein
LYLPADQFAEEITPVVPWTDTVSRGDVLWINPAGPGATQTPLPCLVLEVEAAPRGKRLLVAPSVAGRADRTQAYEVALRTERECHAAGVSGPTRFLGAARIFLRTTSASIHIPQGAVSPISGRLTGVVLSRMNRVRARIYAERDIAADRAARKAKERAADRRRTEENIALHGRQTAPRQVESCASLAFPPVPPFPAPAS